MSQGYIKLHRQIQDNEYYFREPFSRTMAWIDLLLLANHKKKTVRLRGILVTIERGQLAYSIQSLSKRWQRNRKTVMKWLEEFQMDNMLDTKKDNVTTLITIRNYELYQGRLDTKEDTKRDSKLDSKRDTNNNDKNEKKEYIDKPLLEKTPSKGNGNGKFQVPTLEEIRSYCTERDNGVDPEKYIDFYESKGWMVGKNKMKSWKASVRTWEKNNPKQKTLNDWEKPL